ncbi:putative translation initiation factor eIF-2B subunit epsilon [Elsinoe australis]|uniref:Mannose-1-phosphate guanyltransferase n=1 Tax=Elsinoe australis TaxID=40998 RepID=A0A4U7AYD5_9PEZI|nr:putative translation initiation factor eIF-2B subunit epsilon [Elsinoe australis]
MPPKSKRGGDTKGRTEAEEVEEPLQAVVLCDSFETRFKPLTLERPRCLLPLANTSLLEYTLEFLAASGVQEVFLYCGSHTAQIEAYIAASKWSRHTSPFDVLEVLRSTSRSVGDAMRDLDKRAVLASDFVVVYGDVVSNLSLGPALKAHRERKGKDKNSIMTMVLREAGNGHRTKAMGYEPVFVLDPSEERVLAYEQIRGEGQDRGRGEGNRLELDEDCLAKEELVIRTDLIDAGIDICTPDVLALWSDNFDYEVPRRGFLHSVLKDYELNGKKIHVHVEEEGYAARVRDVRSYGAVTSDILGRWTYPLVPDANMVADQTYRLFKGGSYREEGVVLAGSCEVGKKTVIGRATVVGAGSVLENCVVGRRCVIGRNVKITGSYIWDDVTIGDGSVLSDAIVASEASMGKKCTLKAGAILSFGCHVSDGTVVAEKTRITRMKKTGSVDEDEVERGDPDTKVVGQGGEGFLFQDDDEDEDEVVLGLGPQSLYSLPHLSLSQESISTLHSQDLSSEDIQHRTVDSRSASFGSVASDDSQGGGKGAPEFHHEASLQIYESLQKGDETSNMQLELTALRMSADASPHAVRRSVVVAFMKRIAALVETGITAAQAVKQTIPPYKSLLEKTMFDRGENIEEKPDQVDFLILMQSDLRHRKEGEKIMLHASNELVMQDIVETEGFEQWWEDERSQDGDEMKGVRSLMQPFMDAILEEESEEEDDDEDEDEED